MRTVWDYSELKGRIKTKFGTQKAFAEELGVSEPTLCSRLRSNSPFSQDEIKKSADLLGITYGDIPNYFFRSKV